jgi:hypothetical protein
MPDTKLSDILPVTFMWDIDLERTLQWQMFCANGFVEENF